MTRSCALTRDYSTGQDVALKPQGLCVSLAGLVHAPTVCVSGNGELRYSVYAGSFEE